MILRLDPFVYLVGIAVALLTRLVLPLGNRGYRAVRLTEVNRVYVGRKTWLRWRGGPAPGLKSPELVFTEVAALLRAGVPPGAAWRRASAVEVDSYGVPDQFGLAAQVGLEPAVAMAAASQLATRLGAPLAVVLQTVAEALRTESQTRSDRETALAGPQTTARVLLALPFLGLFLGWILGANPVRVLISGGYGTASFIGGVALMGLGRWWISKLVAAAAESGLPT